GAAHSHFLARALAAARHRCLWRRLRDHGRRRCRRGQMAHRSLLLRDVVAAVAAGPGHAFVRHLEIADLLDRHVRVLVQPSLERHRHGHDPHQSRDPNDEPGSTTTPSSFSNRSANAPLGTPAGSGSQRYIVARGVSHVKPAARNASTAASRRSANVRTLSGTKRSQASSAAAPAACTAMNVPVSRNDFTLASTLAISGRSTAHPQRQPVMLYVLDSEWNSIATSRAPSISKMLGGRYPSYASSEYALSYASR